MTVLLEFYHHLFATAYLDLCTNRNQDSAIIGISSATITATDKLEARRRHNLNSRFKFSLVAVMQDNYSFKPVPPNLYNICH